MNVEAIVVMVKEIDRGGNKIRLRRNTAFHHAIVGLEEMMCDCEVAIPENLSIGDPVRVDLTEVEVEGMGYRATPTTKVTKFYKKK